MRIGLAGAGRIGALDSARNERLLAAFPVAGTCEISDLLGRPLALAKIGAAV